MISLQCKRCLHTSWENCQVNVYAAYIEAREPLSKAMAKSSTSRTPYHHGNLVEELVTATIALIEEKGVDAVSVREAAKRAGVSPAAPFRHFANKTALMTAVAEQAMGRLTERVQAELTSTGDADPVEALRAIARGYLGWALANPTHFNVIASRTLIDFHGSLKLTGETEAIRLIMLDLIARGQADGQIASAIAPDALMLSARAFIYGLCRMWIDGHFTEWRVEKPAQDAMSEAVDLFIDMIGSRQATP
ncbi:MULTISPECIES: TetR/AcrR family transcriptional regulator [unclassified Shinella]|uniref:TetR/AcrR family transcriptional regulator n=1 Tax=unclassified Shinella TaxID=2643062 RepID=UPI0024150306|nr:MULTISPECIES: TetR/AcrR family transcriptional regulator [unclassified Shinella]MDG4675321.1 TetR/AcrR family transcriptional regulator [Shinella sp. 838]